MRAVTADVKQRCEKDDDDQGYRRGKSNMFHKICPKFDLKNLASVFHGIDVKIGNSASTRRSGKPGISLLSRMHENSCNEKEPAFRPSDPVSPKTL